MKIEIEITDEMMANWLRDVAKCSLNCLNSDLHHVAESKRHLNYQLEDMAHYFKIMNACNVLLKHIGEGEVALEATERDPATIKEDDEIKVGDRVRLSESYGTWAKGEKFIVTRIDTANNSPSHDMVKMKNPNWPHSTSCYRYRLEKIT